jgi:hypothetical protein
VKKVTQNMYPPSRGIGVLRHVGAFGVCSAAACTGPLPVRPGAKIGVVRGEAKPELLHCGSWAASIVSATCGHCA